MQSLCFMGMKFPAWAWPAGGSLEDPSVVGDLPVVVESAECDWLDQGWGPPFMPPEILGY